MLGSKILTSENGEELFGKAWATHTVPCTIIRHDTRSRWASFGDIGLEKMKVVSSLLTTLPPGSTVIATVTNVGVTQGATVARLPTTVRESDDESLDDSGDETNLGESGDEASTFDLHELESEDPKVHGEEESMARRSPMMKWMWWERNQGLLMQSRTSRRGGRRQM